MSGDTVWISVLAGLSGAPHCVIMCGGIGASIAMRDQRRALARLLAYHSGRILTYGLTGAFMGLAGSFLNVAAGLVGLQSAASIGGGCLIVMWALSRYALPLHALGAPLEKRLHAAATRTKNGLELLALFVTGLLLGWLPCGLTYAMQMRAVATGSWSEGALTLLVFGAATFPMLLAVSLSAVTLSKRWRRGLRRFGYYLAVLMGVLSILKGCSANGWIPSVHPWLW
ncbi:sulfite exporter TauE/SafE family protein [Paenibacillus athensensis]|uniref:Urease accessory protein UreH-like transmembrane domain-containing protein n=1 Tax=Paenibacillus athensensis TaxID=1967502 RepID=A0A4Y8PWJ7_9BACL|nr:sulfite exporter TauE/SafE family protein [Paenibacillus athensensis]MCD1261427.1 sulfite exporter TauE/SafE family protein [Paenibacillus athensensis]